MSESSLPHTNGATKPPLGDDHQAGCQENGRQDANTEGTATSLSKLVVTLDQPPTDSRVPTTTAGALSPMDVGSHDIDDSGYISDESCNYDSAQEDFVPGDLVRKDLAREDSASEYFAPVIEPSIKIPGQVSFP